jgi:hypothetical protein
MNIDLSRLLIIITILCLATFTQADEGRHNLSFSTGPFQMSDTSQVINGINYEIRDTTFQVLAIDYERLQVNGFSFGVGMLAHTNDILYDSSANSRDKANIFHVAGMARKYFKITENTQPYLGLGYGAAFTSGVGKKAGLSFQTNIHALAGIKMKFKKTTLKFEYRNINTLKSSGDTFYLTGQSLLIGFTIKLR